MIKAQFEPYILHFKREAGTSRGILRTKKTYFLTVENKGTKGIGECALFEGLSADDVPDYEEKLNWLCKNINLDFDVLYEELRAYPSIQIGMEQAFLNLQNQENALYFPGVFYEGKKGIPINGLVWMGDIEYMKSQCEEKIQQGFRCIKFKIGVNWEAEQRLLYDIRKQYPSQSLEIRVDANGAFSHDHVDQALDTLKDLEIHSIEQPLPTNNIKDLARVCSEAKIPIALDESLIGKFTLQEKKQLLEEIHPQYIILKPSLIGGFKGTQEWIDLADSQKIGWWVTSALESNVGLNAIAQFTSSLPIKIPQGLGTGGLYTNNIPSHLIIQESKLWHIQ